MKRAAVETRRHLAADEQRVIFDKSSLTQLIQMQESDVAKSLGVALGGGLLEGLEVGFGLHQLHVVVAVWPLVQDGEADGALERPRQQPVEVSLHGVDKEGDEVGAARGVGGLQVQPQAELVARLAGVEAGAVLHHRVAHLLVPQKVGEARQAPYEDAVALLCLQLPHSLLQRRHFPPELGKLARLWETTRAGVTAFKRLMPSLNCLALARGHGFVVPSGRDQASRSRAFHTIPTQMAMERNFDTDKCSAKYHSRIFRGCLL